MCYPPCCVADTTTHEAKKPHLLYVYLNPLFLLYLNKQTGVA